MVGDWAGETSPRSAEAEDGARGDRLAIVGNALQKVKTAAPSLAMPPTRVRLPTRPGA